MVAVIGLGSNLGAREAILRTAADLIGSIRGSRVEAVSALYDTEPLGPVQPRYLNAALRLVTTFSPEELLDLLLRIESILGRKRRERWGPRTIDLDILWTDAGTLSLPSLEIPHPRLRERAFALAPLLDVARELQALYGPALEALGGRPPHLGSFAVRYS